MSSFLSTAYSPTEIQSTFNTPLALKVIATKQGQYDTNKALVDQQMALYNDNLKGLRDSDNEYIAARLQEVSGIINGYGNKDYSITATKDTLLGNLRSITEDPIVKSAVLNRAKYDQANAQVAEKKKKNDGSYSDTNYAYMLEQGGYNAYMKGEIKDLGNLEYHNYIDVTKTALDKVKSFKDLRGDESIEIPFTDTDGVKRTRTTTVKGLTDSEILAYIPQILSPDESSQLQINGWAKYQGVGGLEVAQTTFKNYTKEVENNLDENISKYDAEYKNKNITQEERNKAFQNKIAEEDKKKQYLLGFSSVDINDAASIGGFLETTNWKTNFAKLAGAKQSISYDTDTAAYSAANLEIAQREELRKAEKHPYEIVKLQQEVSPTIGLGATSGVSLSTVEPDQTDETQPYISLVKDFAKQSAGIVAIANTTLQGGGVDDDTKKAYNDNYNDALKRGYAPATATKIAFDKSGMSNLFPEQYANILEEYTRRGNTANVIKEANAQTANIFNTNPKKYIETAENIANSYKSLNEQIKGSLTEDVRRTFQMFLPERQESEAMLGAKEVSKFIQDNGGIKNLEEKLSNPKNTALIDRFTNLVENVRQADTFGGIFKPSYNSAVEESASKRNEVVARKGQGIVNTAQIATVSNPKLAEQIINAIPQEQGKVPFDAKQGITYKSTPAGNFEITQSGTKEGVSGLYGSTKIYTVKPTDDLYKVLNNLTLNEAQRREVTAGNYSTAINNENIKYLDNTQKSTVNRASTFVSNTLGANYQMASKVHPNYFLTPSGTNEAYKGKLRGIIPEDKINALTSLMSTDSYNKFTVTATPVQGQWTTSVSLKKGGSPLLLSEAETGKKNMDRQLLLFVKQYPQITIGEALLEYLQQNPQEIDTVLNRLK